MIGTLIRRQYGIKLGAVIGSIVGTVRVEVAKNLEPGVRAGMRRWSSNGSGGIFPDLRSGEKGACCRVFCR